MAGCYPPCPLLFSGCSGSPITHFFWAMTWRMNWLYEMPFFCNLQSFVVSLLPLASLHLFIYTRSALSHQIFSTPEFPRCICGKTCVFSATSQCLRVFTAMNTTLLNLEELKSVQRLWSPHSRHASSHSVLSCYGLHAARSLVQGVGSSLGFGAPWFLVMIPYRENCRIAKTKDE